MAYLNLECLNALDPDTFHARKPYPWMNPAGIIHDAAYQRLVDSMPDISIFEKTFGQMRKHGQAPHDRYVLEYGKRTKLPLPWQEFVEELRQPPYRTFLQRSFGVPGVALRFHWMYTPSGCSVSPHCDSDKELGTHLFYFNTLKDWDPAWGGSTLVLDDGGRFAPDTAPSFESFVSETPSEFVGNHSLLFARTDRSWHGVRELRCPEGRLRKLFSVIVSSSERAERRKRLFSRPRYAYF